MPQVMAVCMRTGNIVSRDPRQLRWVMADASGASTISSGGGGAGGLSSGACGGGVLEAV
jgi:hypothetical protein